MPFTATPRNRTDGFDVPGDEAQRNKVMRELFAALPPDKMASDGKAYVDFLLAQSGVKPSKAGVVGHCYTGMMAVRIAAAMPDTIAAAASASMAAGWPPTSPLTARIFCCRDQGAALFRPRRQ